MDDGAYPCIVRPPDTLITWPVIKLASSLAKNVTMPARSSGRPIRRSGTDLIIFSRIFVAAALSPPSRAASIMGVLVGPGATVLNVIPSRANSLGRVFDIALTPALQPE